MDSGYMHVYTGNGNEKQMRDFVWIKYSNILHLFTVEEAIEAIKYKASHVEVIITGRYAKEEIIQITDLVTEMKEIKHYAIEELRQ